MIRGTPHRFDFGVGVDPVTYFFLEFDPDGIKKWARDTQTATNGNFQLNLWVPNPPVQRDALAEESMRAFLRNWGPEVPLGAGDVTLPDFDAQCDAILEADPAIVSSIMGLYPERFVARFKSRGIRWFATVTTVAEAKVAESAGAAVFKPGTNLHTSNVRNPSRVNVVSVRRTHESGSSAILQSQLSTTAPFLLPKQYQNVSLTSDPSEATITTNAKLSSCWPASAPAASSSGAAGMGRPACSAITQKNTRA